MSTGKTSGSRGLRENWVDEGYDLGRHAAPVVIGRIDVAVLEDGLDGDIVYRPRAAMPPHKGRCLPAGSPKGLCALYNLAAADMRRNDLDPDKFHLYILYHSGTVAPDDCLREGEWHFDFLRFLRVADSRNRMPVVHSYAASNVLPTTYVTKLVADAQERLPARETISDSARHSILGDMSAEAGHVFQPAPGEIVRYDSLTLHKGTYNRTGRDVHRVFFHIGFSPAP